MRILLLVTSIFIFTIQPVKAEPAKKYNIEDLTKKANQGDSNAQFKLGYAYLQKDQPHYDWEEGLKWWETSANNGEIYGQHNLGSLYYEGTAVEADIQRSTEWYLMAAKQGYNPSQKKLIRNYQEMGKLVDAYAWSLVLKESKDIEYKTHGEALTKQLGNSLNKDDIQSAENKANIIFERK